MEGKQKTKKRKQPKRKKKKISILILAVVIVVIAGYNIVKAVAGGIVAIASEQAKVIEQETDNKLDNDVQNNDVQNNYVENDGVENSDEQEHDEVIDESFDGVTSEEKQEDKGEQQQEQSDFKEVFAKDVFVGDSIVEAMDYYGILNNNSVYAKKGETLSKSMPNIPDIASRRPNKVFLMFGMNDIEIYEKPEEFAKKYEEYINQVRTKMPNSTIYVQSILPVTEKASMNQPKLSDERIVEFNSALKDICQKNNVKYIDTYTFTKQLGNDYYEPDGIHFQYKFYPKWLTYIQNNL